MSRPAGSTSSGKTRTLIEVVDDLKAYDDQLTIYAQEPWTSASLAVVELEDEDGSLVRKRDGIVISYFLEVFIAVDFLDGWESNSPEPIELAAKCNRLIEYATNYA